MKELLINRNLICEDTRKQGILINGKVYSLHIVNDEVVITDNEDYTKIYQITSKEFYDEMCNDVMKGWNNNDDNYIKWDWNYYN